MTAAVQDTAAVTIPDTGIRHEVVMVSSDMAAEWLQKYQGPPVDDPTRPGNRRINDPKVLRFQSDMEAGRWVFDASPIRFSSENPKRILDGQNRLTALANTVPAMELPFLVVHGLARESQMVMDQCEVRTVGQNLHLAGIKNANVIGAASKFYLDWTRDRLFKNSTRNTTTKPEAQEWVLAHPELIGKLFELPFIKVDAPVSVSGAFALAVLQIAPVRAHRFFHQLATGAGLTEGDPILALDRRLRNIRRQGVKVSQREYLAYFIKAWNAWVAGNRLSKMQLSRLTDENFPALLQMGDLGTLGVA